MSKFLKVGEILRSLEEELQYLKSIDIVTTCYDINKCELIKEFAHSASELLNMDEIFKVYRYFNRNTGICFPKIETTIKNNIEIELEELKIRILMCSVDKILDYKKH